MVSIGIVTVLNIVGIVSVARANFLIIAIQAIFIVVFVALAIANTTGYGKVDLLAPFTGDGSAGGFSPILAARPSCACRSWASTRSPRCPRRRATPGARSRRRS